MDIEERVRCRIRLRYEEQEEYENFFPEECKARPGEEKECLSFYQGIDHCWDILHGPSRLSCAKQVIGIENIANEKARCQARIGTERNECNRELKNKVFDLIKFRLYNLEQQVSGLEENGRKLTEDQIVEFVVKLEKLKLGFNAAVTNNERKLIILQARQEWVNLIRQLKGEA